MKEREISGHGQPAANGARPDHHGAGYECWHFQYPDVLGGKLEADRGSYPLALEYQHCHKNKASLTPSHPRVSCCVE